MDIRTEGPVPAADNSRSMRPGVMAPPRGAGWRRRVWRLVALLLIAGLAAGGVVYWRGQEKVPVRYITAPATLGSVERTATATGSVNPEVTVQVGSYVSGVIQTLYCDYNTKVQKGQLCAKIDSRFYETAVAQSKANLATARAQLGKDKANLAFTKLTYERDLGLLKRGIVSQDTLDAAANAYAQAQAQIRVDEALISQREAELKGAEINLGYTNIVSPVDGTVVSRNVNVGQTVAASFQTPTLFLIATDLTRMQVDANVSESDIGAVNQGDPASFTVEAFPNQIFKGVVAQVRQAPISVQNVITYDCVISVSNPDLLLKPGMTATARIITEARSNVLRVPAQALRFSPEGLRGARGAGVDGASMGNVFVLRDGQPVRVPLKLGLNDDSHVEVLGGDLKEGDQVVISEAVGGQASGNRQSSMPRFRL